MARWKVLSGAVEWARTQAKLRALGPFDAMFCDPPYGIKFMGAAWDRGVPSAEVWRALSERLRPGASVVAFGGTRTWHRLAVAMEDSGLEIRDSICSWMYGSGWPKPASVGKLIDKRLGAKREIVGINPNGVASRVGKSNQSTGAQTSGLEITAPATADAWQFDGWHANLAPSWEPALVFRKPLDGTLADNALAHGVAGLWVDGARVPARARERKEHGVRRIDGSSASSYDVGAGKHAGSTDLGRWPKNAILCCEESTCGDAGHDGEHAPGCSVREMNEQSGWYKSGKMAPRQVRKVSKGDGGYNGRRSDTATLSGTHGDAGTAARFFYVAKVSRKERAGIPHPCMKPIALCRQIATLLLPPPRRDGQPRRILVPYSGSGSEMIGALQAGWDQVIGVESDHTWVTASQRRIADELAAWDEAGEIRLVERKREYARRIAVTREAVKAAQDPETLAEYGARCVTRALHRDGCNK